MGKVAMNSSSDEEVILEQIQQWKLKMNVETIYLLTRRDLRKLPSHKNSVPNKYEPKEKKEHRIVVA